MRAGGYRSSRSGLAPVHRKLPLGQVRAVCYPGNTASIVILSSLMRDCGEVEARLCTGGTATVRKFVVARGDLVQGSSAGTGPR